MKWITIGADFMRRDGGFLIRRVHVQGERGREVPRWALHARVLVDGAVWHWTRDALCTAKTKGELQARAEDSYPTRPGAEEPPADASARPPRHSRRGEDESNGSDGSRCCWCCGVRYPHREPWRFGDLCGTNCTDLVREIAEETRE